MSNIDIGLEAVNRYETNLLNTGPQTLSTTVAGKVGLICFREFDCGGLACLLPNGLERRCRGLRSWRD
jgi:hypothetical protein